MASAFPAGLSGVSGMDKEKVFGKEYADAEVKRFDGSGGGVV